MWISHTERACIRRQEAAALTFAATGAEARFYGVATALRTLLCDAGTLELLGMRAEMSQVCLGRSSRLAENGSVEGLAVLEGVVLAGLVARLLSDGVLVRWMARRHPRELAALQGACTELPPKDLCGPDARPRTVDSL